MADPGGGKESAINLTSLARRPLCAAAVDRWMAGSELLGRTGPLAIPATALFMVAIGLIAAAGPARYGLPIQPTEALRSE